jgi:arylformamidase
MKIYDISISITPDMPTYPGDPKVSLTPMLEIARGDNANVSQLCMGDHTGTHLDPPVHFIPGGKTVDQLDLATLYGPVRVLDMTQVTGAITAEDLEQAKLPRDIVRVLLKTINSRLWGEKKNFDEHYVGVSWDAARWLVDHGILLVGIDYLSVELYDAGQPNTHRTLLGAGVIVVEGLDLDGIAPGDYTLACLPLKIQNGDGGPCRAILIER